jgi:hypothetical protein
MTINTGQFVPLVMNRDVKKRETLIELNENKDFLTSFYSS